METAVQQQTALGGAKAPDGASASRLSSIDTLRGAVIVLMALDHARDFFMPLPFAPEDLERTTPAIFLTRWITHFCAPVFILLAGTGTYLWGHGKVVGGARRCRAETSRYLLTRGLWLIVLELTVVKLGWTADLDYSFSFLQVIWAIGASMVVLAGLVWFPLWTVLAFGVVMIGGHNLLDGVTAREVGFPPWLWSILHEGWSQVHLGRGAQLMVIYPLVPWIGVMACGYALGAVFRMERPARWRILLSLGAAIVLLFVALRAINIYGDPRPWSIQERGGVYTVLSFLDVQKYPPSLAFLLMTLGPALIALALLECAGGWLARVLRTFGRVPLFFYVLHLYVIVGPAAAYALLRFGRQALNWNMFNPPPPEYALPLWGLYPVWLGVVAALYPACRWFAGMKARRRDWWLGYL
ncbi:MAG: DUF1624 domain-containing protein [Phycisphaerales bacterium]|nr:DUF1624 domain-containing protein [Phycisphaerales bacterium]